ncbi:FAD:protein FMN transferase, partial [bacterium]|nr:FAD:protein FMN transferase [bacterium]
MKKIVLLLIMMILVGCGDKTRLTKTKVVDGINVEIEIRPDLNNKPDSHIFKAAFKEFEKWYYTTHGEESELHKLNQVRGPIQVSQEFLSFINEIKEIEKLSEGLWQPMRGKIIDLWDLNHPEPAAPDPDELVDAVNQLSASDLQISSTNQVELTGPGNLDPGIMSIGWALDGAAKVLMENNVFVGKISAGGISRFWGKVSDEDCWKFTLQTPGDDARSFGIEPDEGSVCMLNLDDNGFLYSGRKYFRFINPSNGLPFSEPYALAIWTTSASRAAAFTEISLISGRKHSINWH